VRACRGIRAYNEGLERKTSDAGHNGPNDQGIERIPTCKLTGIEITGTKRIGLHDNDLLIIR
jgi:hypothetical protein